ncbi:MAG: gamma-glutamyltransferase [Myxococcales bacterium]|nr:gamma-glutamyltransferase [Myxococcales bacterium]
MKTTPKTTPPPRARSWFWLVAAITVAASVASAAPPGQPEGSTGRRVVPPSRATAVMVSAAHPLAVDAGLAILDAGGSAVDAAIATALALNVVEPQSAGIGGGGFLLAYDAKSKRVRSYDGRETAPSAVAPDVFLAQDRTPLPFMTAVASGRSVGVPGAIRLFELAHRQHGKLPWRALFEPAIRLARDGFVITPRLHGLLLMMSPYLLGSAGATSVFFDAGAPRAAGTLLTQPELARTLTLIADGGPSAFYEGPIALAVVAATRMSPAPGALTTADLEGYRALERDPVCLRRRKDTVCGMGPPSSGGLAVLQILALLEPFSLAKRPEAERVHLFAEASRLAFADRDRWVADPDHVRVPTRGLLEPGYLKSRRKLISEATSLGTALPGTPPGAPRSPRAGRGGERPSTTHLAVVDASGNAVSMTASIENAFGSTLMAAGFFLNNQLTDFSFDPVEGATSPRAGAPIANAVAPGKRPRSSMAPIIALDAKRGFRFAIGSAGGPRIIDFVAWSLVGVLDEGLDPQAALNRPHVINRNGVTELESVPGEAGMVWQNATLDYLRERGHEVTVTDVNSGMHAIERRDGTLRGGADPRREGVARGR